MQIERRDNIVYFNNDHGVAFGYLLDTTEGYRMSWYSGIVMQDGDLREFTREITNFINRVVIKPS
jgi:hypothetical protein